MDEETKNSEETDISFRQSMVQIVYDMNRSHVTSEQRWLPPDHRFKQCLQFLHFTP